MWGDGVGVHFLYLEDGNIIVNFSAMLLGNTFSNPHNVTALLFLEFQVRIEYTKVELLHEGVHVQFDLKMLEYVFSFSALHCCSNNELTSCSKNLSSNVLSPGLFPEPSNSAAYSA